MLALAISIGIHTCMSNHTYKVGDMQYLQPFGGPIGLELTGAVARPFMKKWDKMYLDRVGKAGIQMMLYERYVDDSNQGAVVPPPGARYDKQRKKVIVDPNNVVEGEEENERLSRVLKDVANDIQEGIVMEEDHPGKHDDGKMPILDMKVWMEEGFIMYQHYQKPMASKMVLHAASAQSTQCKDSVHTQEILRRLLNSSTRLCWKEAVAPVISEYMGRLMVAGYSQAFRKKILEKALRIYDQMGRDEAEGIRPIYRPKDWCPAERRRAKERKKNNWSNKGGHMAPIFVPPTPNGELAKALRRIADQEAEDGVRFKIVETGGRTVQSQVQKSNPMETAGCEEPDCLPCRTGRGTGGSCHATGVNYSVECQLCPDGARGLYLGETSRNLYSRCQEHEEKYRNGSEKSFMGRHQDRKHGGAAGAYTAKVTANTRDCLTRQVKEAVQIRRCQVEVLNSKTEWHQPALWQVQSEIYRG